MRSTFDLQLQGRVEGLVGQGSQVWALLLEPLAHGLAPAVDVAPLVAPVGTSEQLVERRHRCHPGHGHQVPPAEAADLAFHAALLVGAPLTRLAEEGVEAEVGAEADEPVGLDPVPAPEDPRDRGRQVVVSDAPRHPAEAVEGEDMTLEQGRLVLGEEAQGDPLRRCGQAQVEQVDDDGLARDDHRRLPEVDLGLPARLVEPHDGHVRDPRAELGPEMPDDVADGRLRDLRIVLLDQALPDTARGVALLARRVPVGDQPCPDDRRSTGPSPAMPARAPRVVAALRTPAPGARPADGRCGGGPGHARTAFPPACHDG